jgi:superfamily I DNA/RNA helicase
VGAVAALEADPQLRLRWQARFSHLCVDEFQDVDAAQLRLIRLLAAPEDNLFVVGDDDQTIYAWRLADVRRVIGLAAELPGLRRIDLVTNYRCPPVVVVRAVRLVEHNRERFAKHVRAGPQAAGRLLLVADGGDEVARARRLLGSWRVPDSESRAILARTNAELAPYAAAALELGIPYRGAEDGLLLDAPEVDVVLAAAKRESRRRPRSSLLEVLVAVRPSRPRAAAQASASLISWAPGCHDVAELRRRIETCRMRHGELRRDDAGLVLATVHGTKGLEFDNVCCVGLDEGRFPSARSLAEAADPVRVLEEERRLAYVAWTRARRSLLLLHDPHAPSIFLREAFDEDELAAA